VEGSNILQSLAEDAVTLTGLSGIVVALGGRSDEVFRAFTENRFAPMGFLAFSGLAFVRLIVDLRKTQP
jgi:hypothetical protein